MRVVMIVPVPMRGDRKFETGQDAQCEHDDQQTADEKQPRLGLFEHRRVLQLPSEDRQNPDDDGVADRGRKREQHGLGSRAVNGDDERRHHRFRMPGLERMQCAEDDGNRKQEARHWPCPIE